MVKSWLQNRAANGRGRPGWLSEDPALINEVIPGDLDGYGHNLGNGVTNVNFPKTEND